MTEDNEEQRTALVKVRVKPSAKAAFVAKAKAKDLSEAEAVRQALRDWMEKP